LIAVSSSITSGMTHREVDVVADAPRGSSGSTNSSSSRSICARSFGARLISPPRA
jgi:hypothetical protein